MATAAYVLHGWVGDPFLCDDDRVSVARVAVGRGAAEKLGCKVALKVLCWGSRTRCTGAARGCWHRPLGWPGAGLRCADVAGNEPEI